MKIRMAVLSLIVLASVFTAGCYNTCTLKKRSERRDGASFTAAIREMNNQSRKN